MIGSNKTPIKTPFGSPNFAGAALVILALTLLAGAMSSDAGEAGESPALGRRQERRYELKGFVQSVDKAKKRATIRHEKVGDLMDAMTMPFLIKDEKALNEIGPGDQIKGILVTTSDGGMWLEKITIIAKASKENASTAGGDQPDEPSELMGESVSARRLPPSRLGGKLFHLFLVSQDLSDFQHIHPRQLSDGGFVIKTLLKRPGLYKVYTDIYPLDGAPQFLQTNISAAGWRGDLVAGQAHLTPDATMTKAVGGVKVTSGNAEALGIDLKAPDARPAGDLKVELQPDSTPLICGRKITLKYRLTDVATGQPARDLIPYLGAWGHMLILSEDQTEAIHSHTEETIPEEADLRKARGGPDLSFDVLFPAPGNYRVWAQFLRGDKLSTVAFDLRAERPR
jgi:Cu/Ag efflux protein CusF